MRRNGCGEVLAVIEQGRRVAGVLTLSTAGIVEILVFRVYSASLINVQGLGRADAEIILIERW